MIKSIKLCFVCCLIFRATFVEAVNPYDELKKIDEEFWRDKIVPYYQEQLERWQNTFALLFDPGCPIAQNVASYLDPICKDGLPELFDPDYENSREDFREADRKVNFSSASMLDIISSFYRILQCKVDNRDEEYETSARGKIWEIRYDENGYALDEEDKVIDPYFTEITSVCEKVYHLHLNYDGGDKIKYQPGNCCLRQKSDLAARSWCSYNAYNSILNDNDHYVLQNLLLCLEVSRRIVVDPKRDYFKDMFCDLPILGAIVIGLKLMNDQIINKDDFFATGRKYCCFSNKSGNYIERENHINNLLREFVKYKNFRKVDQFRKEVRRLYQQFIELKITDRVLYLNEEHRSVIQKYPYCKLMPNVNSALIKSKCHVVDINRTSNNMCFAVQQCMNPQNYYEQEDENIPFAIKGENLLDKIKSLEKDFQRKVIILDATGRIVSQAKNFAIFFSSEKQKFLPAPFEDILKHYKKPKIILLWRGDRWQAVLPD